MTLVEVGTGRMPMALGGHPGHDDGCKSMMEGSRGRGLRMRVVLATDRSDLSDAICLFLSDRCIDVVDVVDNAQRLCARAARAEADVVLVDWRLGASVSTQAVVDLNRRDTPIPAIVLTTSQEQDTALASGAAAFATLGDPPETLIATLNEVARAAS